MCPGNSLAIEVELQAANSVGSCICCLKMLVCWHPEGCKATCPFILETAVQKITLVLDLYIVRVILEFLLFFNVITDFFHSMWSFRFQLVS